MKLEIRKAAIQDIKDIKKILSFYCLDTEKVEKNLPEFIIAVLDQKIVGCACLDIGNIVELRSIAVLPNYRNKGLGSKLLGAIQNRAVDLTDTVYIRTTSPAFFEKKRFQKLQNDEKKEIWKECSECDKFEICRQTVMKITLPVQNC
ncbi:MAG TPA: GNAT family N-acetyltransferase [Candidatus Methanoperedens sp.]